MSGRDWVKENLFDAAETREDSGGPASEFRQWLAGVALGEAQRSGDLTIVPLLHQEAERLPFLTAHEAMAAGHLKVTEKEGGVVGEVVARNEGRRGVLVFEGETLVGCKQNRVVAHTVLVAPGKSVVIPVGCMEQGRWDLRGVEFSTGSSPMEPSLRRAAVLSTMASRSAGRGVRLDQGRLWRDVAFADAVSHVLSPTRDYHETLERREAEVRDEVSGIESVEGQVGLLGLWRGRLLGLELVGHAETWSTVGDRTLTSYVMAGRSLDLAKRRVGGQVGPGGPKRSPEEWLEALRGAKVEKRPALGEGVDLELRGPGLTGTALWCDGAPAHVTVFGN